ncbi:MAG: hypothetical protein ACTSUE_22750 [Promethearchaeota archaeon]
MDSSEYDSLKSEIPENVLQKLVMTPNDELDLKDVPGIGDKNKELLKQEELNSVDDLVSLFKKCVNIDSTQTRMLQQLKKMGVKQNHANDIVFAISEKLYVTEPKLFGNLFALKSKTKE